MDGSCTCGLGWTGNDCGKPRTNAQVFVFQNVLLVIMAQPAILIAHVRTMEFVTDFLEAASASKATMEETVNMKKGRVVSENDQVFPPSYHCDDGHLRCCEHSRVGMRKWAHLSWDTGLNGRHHEDARTVRTDQQDQEDRQMVRCRRVQSPKKTAGGTERWQAMNMCNLAEQWQHRRWLKTRTLREDAAGGQEVNWSRSCRTRPQVEEETPSQNNILTFPFLVCLPGFYGLNCAHICDCKNGASCDAASGQCLCPAGFHGSQCEKECSPGMFGENCHQLCNCETESSCHPVTGKCLCPPGRTGARCDV
ncbi:Multiple epidermal growth factor-like domains protein 6, partial [Galemys pyrenaicus]